ncbi:DUF2889 domain-containing protein [Rhodococcus chondri]|uniref:DUF2889 domain-containing protein n=1 Tax=Rhodococcus chondri TaxID=3065941 RepID=A0ABU7JXU0_9NOCA|nr:DUF2889 domain-containing protein [Rhodococcus sp. CC-R104]MEE2034830.1 DUF2889 domain-containing protein [Rhodococcus sp. CC-R104]
MTSRPIPPLRVLHPNHGVHDPSTATPSRRAGSVRRTSSIDMLRPGGLQSALHLVGIARDLVTGDDGAARVASGATLGMEIDFLGGRTITRMDTDPADETLQGLVGTSASVGFRGRLDEVAPHLRRAREPLHLLLDDVPGTTLISGNSLSAAGALRDGVRTGYIPAADQCAGFVSGGTLMTSFETVGASPLVTGPQAPAIEDTGDPEGWHRLPTLPEHGMRRRRRIDVYRCDTGPREEARYGVDAWFRDTHVDADGLETIVHEYHLDATFDGATGRVLSSIATPRVLPWQECPGAVASASRITGLTLDELHLRVRRDLRGTSTCTHLNDLLRSLADAAALAEMLGAA